MTLFGNAKPTGESMINRIGRVNDIESGTKAMLDRHKSAARLFVAGLKGPEVAEKLGLHPAYMPKLRQHPNVRQQAEVLHGQCNSEALSIKEKVDDGAKSGLGYLLDVFTVGTEANVDTDSKTKVRVAQDLLDREGTAPRMTRTQSQSANVNMNLSVDDIADIKQRAAKARGEKGM